MGIVRKKKGITTDKSNSNSSNSNSSSSLQYGGGKTGSYNSAAPKKPKVRGPGHIKPDDFVKRDSPSISRLQKTTGYAVRGAKATWEATKALPKAALQTGLALAVAAPLTAARLAFTAPAQAVTQGAKVLAGSVALGAKAGYQKAKLSLAQKALNKKSGASIFTNHQKKQAQSIANYNKQRTALQTKTGMFGKSITSDARQKSLEALNASFKAKQTARNDNLTKKMGTFEQGLVQSKKKLFSPSTWSKKKNEYSGSSKFNINQFKTPGAKSTNITNFSKAIADKKAEYTASQTQKQTNKKAKITQGASNAQAKAQDILKQKSMSLSNQQAKQTAHDTLKETLQKLQKTATIDMNDAQKQSHYALQKTAQDAFDESNKGLSIIKKQLSKAKSEQAKAQKTVNSADKLLDAATARADKKISGKKYYTSEQLQGSINRRRSRLNQTKKQFGKLLSNAGDKISRTFGKAGNMFQTLSLTGDKKARDAKEAAYQAEKTKRLEAAKQTETPGILSTIGQKLSLKMAKGAEGLQKSVEHLQKLEDLQPKMTDLEKEINQGKGIEESFEFEKNKLIAEGKEKSPEMNVLKTKRDEQQAKKTDLFNLQSQFEQRQNRLKAVTAELKNRTPPEKIKKVQDIFEKKIKDDKYQDVKAALGGNIEIGKLDSVKLNALVETAKAEALKTNNYSKSNLLTEIYKLDKAKKYSKTIDEELQTATTPSRLP